MRAGERCVASFTAQRSLNGARSRAAAGAVPAAARCLVGGRLIMANAEADDGSGRIEGTRFRGLPPAVRSDMLGMRDMPIFDHRSAQLRRRSKVRWQVPGRHRTGLPQFSERTLADKIIINPLSRSQGEA